MKSDKPRLKRNTVQGQLIYSTLKQMKGSHPSALDIHRELMKEYPGISTATIYSHLRALVKEGKLQALSSLGSAERFDIVLTKHYHIKCESCGVLSDLSIEVATGMDESAEAASGYKVYGHHTIFYGICPICNEKQNKVCDANGAEGGNHEK